MELEKLESIKDMKISVILTAFKEQKTIAKAVSSICDPKYSGFDGSIELIQLSPDVETLEAGLLEAQKYPNTNLVQIKDPANGKPNAINLGLKNVSGEIIILTDGDIYLAKNAIANLVKFLETNIEYGAVTGRPVSADSKKEMMGYFGHLFADANHYRRMIDLKGISPDKSRLFVKKHKFFPLSGYIMAIRRDAFDFRLPEDTLVDDAYISYMIYNKGYKLGYEPEAIAYIKYPKNLSDYFKQKKRSTGGYVQLWKYGIVKEETKSRSPWHEIEMFWYPFKYAASLKEYIWSTLLIPIRSILWIQIIFEQKILKRDFEKIWVRIESTK